LPCVKRCLFRVRVARSGQRPTTTSPKSWLMFAASAAVFAGASANSYHIAFSLFVFSSLCRAVRQRRSLLLPLADLKLLLHRFPASLFIRVRCVFLAATMSRLVVAAVREPSLSVVSTWCALLGKCTAERSLVLNFDSLFLRCRMSKWIHSSYGTRSCSGRLVGHTWVSRLLMKRALPR